MEAGELETAQIFEETTTKNLKMVVAHANETRKGLVEMRDELVKLRAQVMANKATIEQFKVQLAGVQTKLFSSGTS